MAIEKNEKRKKAYRKQIHQTRAIAWAYQYKIG
jgi:hypothetical protein